MRIISPVHPDELEAAVRDQYSPVTSKSNKSLPSVLPKYFDLLRYDFHSFHFPQLLPRPHLPGVTSPQRGIFRRCANSVNDTQITPFLSPAAKPMRLLTRCLPPNMTEEKGKASLTCCATGTRRPGADLRNCRKNVSESFKRRTSLGQVFLPSLFADQVVLLRLQRTARRIRTDEVAGMGKLTARHRYAAVVIFLRRLPLPLANESLFFMFCTGLSDRLSDGAHSRPSPQSECRI